MKKIPEVLGLVYGFGEVNHAVFQNAGMWKLKSRYGVEVWGYAPAEYLGLYWSMDVKNTVAPSPFANLAEVYGLQKSSVSRKSPRTWISSGARNHARNLLLGKMPSGVLHRLPKRAIHDFRSRHFLFDTGIFAMVKNHFENMNRGRKSSSIFLGTGIYRDLSNLGLLRHDLKANFQKSFEILKEQICKSSLAPFGSSYILATLNPKYKGDVDKVLSWMSPRNPVIFLRTRNIDNNVRFQNARVEYLKPVVEILLGEGVSIINSGTPASELCIKHENYLHWNHGLPVDIELSIAVQNRFVMNTAWAGLFTAVSTLRSPLITFDSEWSTNNLDSPVSLLDARREIGLNDICLGNQLYDGGAKKIANRLLSNL